MKTYQKGATLTELIIVVPLVSLLGMTGLQYTLMYNAKTNLTYASYEAARAGAINHADPAKIQDGLIKGMLPYFSANGYIGDNITAFAKAKAFEAPFMKVEIVSPTAEAYNDFNNPTLQRILNTKNKVIPNKGPDLENLKAKKGSTSGITISEANVLKLRITYGYKPNIPIAKNLLSGFHSFFSGPKDTFSMKLLATQRIPIVVDVSAQMLSPPVQNGLKTVSYNPGNTNGLPAGGHNLPDLGNITLPDLSELDLPNEYEGMTRDEIIENIKKNGMSNPSGRDNNNWIKILVGLGIILVSQDKIDAMFSNNEGSGADVEFDFNNPNDLFSDFNSAGDYCSAGG